MVTQMQLEVIFGRKSHSHRRLVKQRQQKSQLRRKRKAEIVSVSVLSKVLSVDKIVVSTNLEYRARERQRKRESGRQASEAQREKGRQGFKARDKKQRRHFLVGRTT